MARTFRGLGRFVDFSVNFFADGTDANRWLDGPEAEQIGEN